MKLECSCDLHWQHLVMKLSRGKIDRDPELAETLATPMPQLPAGGIQHPHPIAITEPQLLDDRDEPRGRNRPERWMRPAEQDFRSRELSRAQIDERLEDEPQLILAYRVLQILLDDQPLARFLRVLLLRMRDRLRPVPSDAAETSHGACKELLGRSAIAGDLCHSRFDDRREPPRGGDYILPDNIEKRPHFGRGGAIVDGPQPNGEAVSVYLSQHVAWPHSGREALGQLMKYLGSAILIEPGQPIIFGET
jgi:hypothetical protein